MKSTSLPVQKAKRTLMWPPARAGGHESDYGVVVESVKVSVLE
jgi:hypothetical protein